MGNIGLLIKSICYELYYIFPSSLGIVHHELLLYKGAYLYMYIWIYVDIYVCMLMSMCVSLVMRASAFVRLPA